MAVAFGSVIGSNAAAGPQQTLVITTTATANVGERLVVCGSYFENFALTSVTDSAGNTYAIDIENFDGVRVFIASTHVTTQLSSGGTITATSSNASTTWFNSHAASFTGVASSSAVDTTNATQDDDATQSTTATSLSTNDGVIVGVFALRDGTDRSRSSGSGTAIAETKGGSINQGSQYQLLTASGSYNSQWVWSGTDLQNSNTAHVIYKGDAGPPPPAPKIRVVQSTLRW
jgi:hypothetical protein